MPSAYWSKRGLILQVEGPQQSVTVAVDKPYARVGTHRSSEVVLDDPDCAVHELYFHATDEGIFVVRIRPSDGEMPGQWLAVDEPVIVGRHRICVQFDDHLLQNSDLPPLDAKGSAGTPFPVISIRSEGRRLANCRQRRALTIVGRSHPSTLRIKSPYVSATHCVLYWQDGRLWVIDLLSSNGSRKDDKKFHVARFRPGREILLGRVELLFARESNRKDESFVDEHSGSDWFALQAPQQVGDAAPPAAPALPMNDNQTTHCMADEVPGPVDAAGTSDPVEASRKQESPEVESAAVQEQLREHLQQELHEQLTEQRDSLAVEWASLEDHKTQFHDDQMVFEADRQQLDADREFIKEERERLHSERAQLERQEADLQQLQVRLDQQQEQLTGERSQCAEQLEQLDAERRQCESRNQQLDDELEDLASKQNAIEVMRTELESRLAEHTAEREQFEAQRLAWEQSRSAEEQQLEQGRQAIAESDLEIDRQRRALAELQAEFDSIREQLVAERDRINADRQRIAEERDALQAERARLETLFQEQAEDYLSLHRADQDDENSVGLHEEELEDVVDDLNAPSHRTDDVEKRATEKSASSPDEVYDRILDRLVEFDQAKRKRRFPFWR